MPKKEVLSVVKLTQKQFEDQLKKIPHLLDSRVLDFEQKSIEYARKVFENSFKYQRYYSAGGEKWKKLSDTTIKKRMRKKTWHNRKNILNEYGTLMNSLVITDKSLGLTRPHFFKKRVYTAPEKFNVSTNPHKGFCYAGIHNNPYGDTYGTAFGGKPAIQRQFMGYSTYIDKFMDKNIDRYLFDKVFGNGADNPLGFIDDDDF